MKTEDFISLLATQAGRVDRRRATWKLLTAWAAGAVGSGVLMAAVLRINSALSHEAQSGMFWVRAAYCACLALLAMLVLHRLGRPGTRMGLLPVALAMPVLAVWLLALAVLLNAPADNRIALLVGHTAFVCPWLITLLAAPLFVALIGSTRAVAPTRLRLTGAAAGLAAGAAGALIYTLHCPELAPPFFATWYLLGMLIPAALGACLGPRLLHW